MPIFRKLRTFAAQPPAEQFAFAEAVLLLTYTRILVNFVPSKRWRNQIAVSKDASGDAVQLDKSQKQIARLVMRAIKQAGRNVPVEFVCLPQALAARSMLTRRGLPSELFIGTKLAAEEDREFHAWLKSGEVVVTGHCDEAEYAVFGTQRRP
ncbi:lasso peptide biosynthesis B2 protein [Pontixanthobacter aquaemixtae]|uniref:Lasso peptide biosynthesis B2 protein n=1 Tax=Pontixanthobacter aquaemixtae TaxID=1958940 RepID=A0A844ZR63_9SPHN|nr:lasso peptide biosynthesis B2 protein [Pontixanthobacter aquaemixtae]MXO90811.1 lasso peptide biosynthesis B2 protein [Pontixanthobacter aquaemixtae]